MVLSRARQSSGVGNKLQLASPLWRPKVETAHIAMIGLSREMYQNNTNEHIVACNVPAVSPRGVRPAFRPQPLVGVLCSAVLNQHRAHIESFVQITRFLHAVVQLKLPPGARCLWIVSESMQSTQQGLAQV